MNKKTNPASVENTTPAAADDVGFDDDVSTGEKRKAYALLEEESRLQVCVTSIAAIGNETFRGADGKSTESYKISLQMTSGRPRRYEDGEEATGLVEFNQKYTFSLHEKGKIATSGLAEALGLDTTKVYTLNEFAKAVLGNVISGRVKHRKYKDDKGVERIAQELEAFKPVKDKMDTDNILNDWQPPFMLIKKYPDKPLLPAAAFREGLKAKPVAAWAPQEETESVK